MRKSLLQNRTFMSQKLTSINILNDSNEQDRKHCFARIQGENTTLIDECNSLRMEKHSFQNKIGEQLKEAKTLAEEMSKIL